MSYATKKLSVACCFISILSGCMPYSAPEFYPASNEFPGLSRETSADVLSVHGMCTHTKDWVFDSWNEMAEALSMTHSKQVVPWKQVGLVDIWKTSLRGSGSPTSITAYAIVWSGLTAAEKQGLCYDASEETGTCRKSSGAPKRASINSDLKTNLVSDCLSDAVIYLGASGETIRQSVRLALETVGADRTSRNNKLFLITESLGSKLLADVLRTKSEHPNLEAAISNPGGLYMAANQIPLLELGTQTPGSEESVQPQTIVESLRIGLQPESPLENNSKPIPFVLFSDPNDLLTYELDQSKLDAYTTNVRVSIARTYFGLLANPLRAHSGYLEEASVWKLIGCGRPSVCN